MQRTIRINLDFKYPVQVTDTFDKSPKAAFFSSKHSFPFAPLLDGEREAFSFKLEHDGNARSRRLRD